MKRFVLVHFVLLMTFSHITAAPLPEHWHETNGYGTKTKGGIA